MNNKYFKKIKVLLEQAVPRLATPQQLTFKNVFGAVGGYVHDHIFIAFGRFGIALKLPPEILDNLFQEKGVKHLKYFPKGHIKKEYAVLPKRMIEDKTYFKKLIHQSIKHALSS